MRTLIPMIAALVLFAYALPSDAQVLDRRWIVQTSDGKLIGFTDDQDVDPPDAAFATFVLESVIRAGRSAGSDRGNPAPRDVDCRGLHGAERRRDRRAYRSDLGHRRGSGSVLTT